MMRGGGVNRRGKSCARLGLGVRRTTTAEPKMATEEEVVVDGLEEDEDGTQGEGIFLTLFRLLMAFGCFWCFCS